MDREVPLDAHAKRRRLLLVVIAGCVAAWAGAALWAVPALIASAYAGESLPVLNRLISGQSVHPVSHYLDAWRRLAVIATGLGVIAVVLVHAAVANAREIARQLRLAAAGLPFPGVAGAVVFALWIGILGGIGETANGLAQQRIRFLATGDVAAAELLWMIPLAAAVSLAVLGVVLAVLDRLPRSHGLVLGLSGPVLAGVGSYSLLRSFAIGVAVPAAVILALGVATATMRALASSPQRSRRVVRLGAASLTSVIVVWAAAVPFWRDWRADLQEAALPPAAEGAPNVLIVVLDAVRAASLSTYGYERETSPVLTRLAANGVLFERAYATSPWSLPSHAAMLTGRYPHELSTDFDSPLDAAQPSVAEALVARGYATGTFTANLFYGSAAFGLDRGFTWYDDRPPTRVNTVVHSWWLSRRLSEAVRMRRGNYQRMVRRDAEHVNRAFGRWLTRHEDRPFLAVLNYFDAHGPYIAPPPWDTLFAEGPVRGWFAPGTEPVTPQLRQDLLAAYDACIRYIDDQLGALIELLRASGRLDNTLLIITSDHGEQFAEERRNLMGHGLSLFPSVLHVPLVLHFPGRVPPGVRADATVSIRDIPATIMHAVGADPASFPGVSLLRFAAGDRAPAPTPRLAAAQPDAWAAATLDWAPAKGHQFTIIDGDVQYIVDGTGAEHLYDLSADPWTRHNLVDDEDAHELVERYRMLLDSLVPAGPDGQRTAVRPSEGN